MDIQPSTLTSAPAQYGHIQVLRFVAAFMVMLVHSSFYASERLMQGSYVYQEGANGVHLFFAISGFVMVTSSERLIPLAGGWKVFAIKRLVRIVPIYWIITTCKLLVMLCQKSLVYHADLDLANILKSYLFIPSLNVDGEYRPLYGVGWTLNLEMFFYLLFAMAMAIRVRPIVFLGLIFVPLGILSAYHSKQWGAMGFYADPIVLNFLYGMVAATLILKGTRIPKHWIVPIAVTGLLYLFIPHIGPLAIWPSNKYILGPAAFAVVYAAASVNSYPKTKSAAWLIYLGGASYSLYLVHPGIAPLAPTLLRMAHIKWPLLSVVLSVLSSTVAALFFYRVCERPLTKWPGKTTGKRKAGEARPIVQ